MSEYGILKTGYAREPLGSILARVEELMRNEFGADVIQTAATPLGQINGIFSGMAAIAEERNEALYQSRDPDQAEGVNLDILARLRPRLFRGNLTDAQLRQAITNFGEARVNLRDISHAIQSVDGVTYSHVFVNETGETKEYKWERSTIVIAVIGGDDEEIANLLWNYVTPGISTYGNHQVFANIEGFCRLFSVIRPIEIKPELVIHVRVFNDSSGCPPPDAVSIRDAFVSAWQATRLNGKDLTDYTVRSIIESTFDSVEYLFLEGSRDMGPISSFVDIGFIEIATLEPDNVQVVFET